MRLTRREVFGHAPIALASTACVLRSARGQSEEPTYVEAKTAYGRVRGAQTEGLVTFKGIPYAGPVSGANRFKAAPALKPWTGVRDALTLGAPAIQPGQRRNEPAQDEDCLFLNVWTPEARRGAHLPVMVYIHGGAYSTGSVVDPLNDGRHLYCPFCR